MSVKLLNESLVTGPIFVHVCYSIMNANYDWPFRTLPFRFFWSTLDTRDLKTYPRACGSEGGDRADGVSGSMAVQQHAHTHMHMHAYTCMHVHASIHM